MSAMMESVEKRKTTAADMQGTIKDFGMLLQTSILAMGDQPRMPKRQGQEIRPQDRIMGLPADALLGDTVRQARQRTGLDTSLAEILVDAGGCRWILFGAGGLRQRQIWSCSTNPAHGAAATHRM
jgi:hypothetical protein